ncbi:hypothetical protein GQ457_14G014240 [Hibiscus cannabinus]
MLKGKALIKEIDMPEKMQTQAIDYAFQALDFYDVSDCISIAAHIKMLERRRRQRALPICDPDIIPLPSTPQAAVREEDGAHESTSGGISSDWKRHMVRELELGDWELKGEEDGEKIKM